MYENNDEIKIILARCTGNQDEQRECTCMLTTFTRTLLCKQTSRQDTVHTMHTHGTDYSDQQKGTIVTLVDRTHLFEAY